jgi:Gram-negative bacterial TonB protein C-terminal
LSTTLQLERTAIPVHDAPKLLVEWSPRWEEFVTSIRPAFGRSGSRLAGEAPHGVSSHRSMAAALLLEVFLLFVVMVLPRQIARMRPYAAPKLVPYEVIYYSGDELPRTEDVGGAQAGTTGRAGGRQAHHRTQTIRVARGASLVPKVVDAPNLKLPSSSAEVANLLAMKAAPGAPSSEGLRSSLVAPRLSENVVAPAASNVSREQGRNSPALNAAVVPPAPSVESEHTLVAPSLNSSVIAPAPNVSRDRTLATPALNANIVAPASTRVSRDRARSTPDLQGSVIPPAPTSASREVSPSRVQMNSTAVVPPPVSAPERESDRTAKLNMPAPSVIAPAPSVDSTRELRRLESGGALGTSQSIVPPPPTATNNTSFVSSIIGKLFGTQDVVPPPSVSSGGASGTSRSQNGSAGGLASNVIPPPPSGGGSGNAGSSGTSRRGASGNSPGVNVIPPPPSVSSGGVGGSGTGNASTLASNVIPPPPGIGGGSTPFGSGSGRKGSGLGGLGDVGSALAPPKGGNGNSDNSGIVLSSQPGSTVGLPGNGGKGALAMSPGGGDKPGLGGLGNGSGIGSGNGPGSGLTGESSGSGKSGAGRGSDPNARGGISPTPGPGGAGNATSGSPSVPGVDVRGGSTVVTLPSFGAGGEGTNDPNLPGRSSVQGDKGPPITIVATSSSGGAFDFYGKLPGDNYTVYVDTPSGTAVMQFAEVTPGSGGRTGPLTGPQGLRTELPKDLPHSRVVVKCKVDASGNLKNLQVLEAGPAVMTAKIVAALPGWKFRPAMRGGQPIEINAILGFNINTNDRY